MKKINESSYYILGMGNIGKILVKRLVDSGTLCENIMVYDPNESRITAITNQYCVKPVEPSSEQIRKADVVILATPPKAVMEVLKSMAENLSPDQIVISMAAAVKIERMHEVVKKEVPVLRILPNPQSMLKKGVNPVAFESCVSAEVKEFAFSLLDLLGFTLEVEDDSMAWCVGLSGAILRTLLPVLEGLTQAGLEAGLSEKDARRIAAQNMAGVAALALETDLSFDQIRSLTPMQTMDEKMAADLFLDTARNTRQKVESTQASLLNS